jgi:hypothetical protein
VRERTRSIIDKIGVGKKVSQPIGIAKHRRTETQQQENPLQQLQKQNKTSWNRKQERISIVTPPPRHMVCG